MPFCALVRILVLMIAISPFAVLHAQNRAVLASKLISEAQKDPGNKMNEKKLSTAVIYLTDALKEQGIECYTEKEEETLIPYIVISTEGEHYLNKFAKTMNTLNVELLFHPYYLLDKEAWAMFEPGPEGSSKSKIFMNREFIENYGSANKTSIKHEMRHFLSFILEVMGYDSVYAGGLAFSGDVDPKKAYSTGFLLDEMPAYSESLYEETRRLYSAFKELYLGFHPEVGNIIKELNSYITDNVAEGDIKYQKAKKGILDFVYSYSYNISDNELRLKKIDGLLGFLYLHTDKDKELAMREKILALANRDLMAETDEILKDPSASYYDVFTLGSNLKRLEYLMAYTKESSIVLNELSGRTKTALNSILSRKNTLSHKTSTAEGYESSWKYTTGMTINHAWRNSTITGKKVHIFDVETDFGIKLYRVDISSETNESDPREMMFKRVEEQLSIANNVNEQNKNIFEKIEELQSLFKTTEKSNLSAKEIAIILRTKASEVVTLSKDLSKTGKDSFSSDTKISEAIPLWKEYLESIKDELPQTPEESSSKTPKNNVDAKEEYQFCQYDFDNMEENIVKDNQLKKRPKPFSLMLKKQVALVQATEAMNEYLGSSSTDYLELLKGVTKKIADKDFKIGAQEMVLFFGENYSGGLYDYLRNNNSIKEYQTYIILFGVILSDEQNLALLDQVTSSRITIAFGEIGILDLETSAIVEGLRMEGLIPVNKIKDMTIAVDLIKTNYVGIKK